MKQYLFYQHNVQQFFIQHRDKYAGVIAPLSIATSYPGGTLGFFQALFATDQNKEFLIDPRSALFQKNWDRANKRETHEKMAAVFGEPITSQGLIAKLEPQHLPDERLRAITHSCISYQQSFRHLQQEQKKKEKYMKLLGVDSMPEIKNLQLFIPPYFEFGMIGDAWYEIALKAIQFAVEKENPVQLRPVLHFSNFDDLDWKGTIDRLKALKITSVFLYPNNYREHDESQDSLKKYRSTVETFADAGVEPYSLHGGYFAISLNKLGLKGFGNGVGYGEWRNSGYHKGGSAELRIYILKLHRFVEPARAQILINMNPDFFALGTPFLQSYAEEKRPIQGATLSEALEHFMLCRQFEMNFVRDNSKAKIVEDLSQTVEVVKGMGEIGAEYLRSLSNWKDALTD